MARRTKAEAEQTREQILDAAEAVFLDRGVARASLEEIAQAAGVTRGAVYWHFRNKADVFDAMYCRVHLPMEDLFNQVLALEDGEAVDALGISVFSPCSAWPATRVDSGSTAFCFTAVNSSMNCATATNG